MEHKRRYSFPVRITGFRQKLACPFRIEWEGIKLWGVPNGTRSNSRPALYLENLWAAIELVSDEFFVNGVVQSLPELLLVAGQVRICPAPNEGYPHIGSLFPEYHASTPIFQLLPRRHANGSNIGVSRLECRHPGRFLGHQVQSQPLKVDSFVFGKTVVRLIVVVLKSLKCDGTGPDMLHETHGSSANGVLVIGYCRGFVVHLFPRWHHGVPAGSGLRKRIPDFRGGDSGS